MNALKWASLRWKRDVYDFKRADEIIAFAEDRDLPVHGHALLWYAYNPAWVDAIETPREAERVLRDHISTVASRYGSRISTWDVVNEVVAHDPIREGRWRDGVWHRTLGAEHVEIAFEAAAEASTGSRLMLNDYDLEDDSLRTRERQDAIVAIVDRLQARGLRIDSIGMQAHLYAERQIGERNLRRFIQALADRGVSVAVTELDVIDWRLPADPHRRDRAAADLVDRYLSTIFAATTPDFVTTWGLSDRYSWIGETFPRDDTARARPLPLDEDLRPKALAEVVARYTTGTSARH